MRVVLIVATVIAVAVGAGMWILVKPAGPTTSLPGVSSAGFTPPFAANLLFISVDTLRTDHLGCFGYERPTSPNLDALSDESHFFTQCYSVMPTTLPAHTTMFTSLYPVQHGALKNEHKVPPGVHMLAERLKENGFRTGACVGASVLRDTQGFSQGFETYVLPRGADWPAMRVVKAAAQFLDAHKSERFFYFAHMYDPHIFYAAPPEFRAKFGVTQTRLPRQLAELEFLDKGFDLTPSMREAHRNAYDAEIAYADHAIGELLKLLRVRDLYDRTIIVFTSDHGETLDELYEKYRYVYDHGEFLYRRELHIPLMIRLPAGFPMSGAARHDAQATQLDFMPTVLELLGVPCDKPFEGRSLVPVLAGGSIPAQPVVAERRQLQRLLRHPALKGSEHSVINDGWHMLLSTARGEELYDMHRDPFERTNVAAANGRQIAAMKQILRSWLSDMRPMFGESVRTQDKAHLRTLEGLGYMVDDDDEEEDDAETPRKKRPASAPSAAPADRPDDEDES
jgi:arylsulfatase A-like enzyme